MDKLGIDPSLLYLEVPLYTSDLPGSRCQEILINEGESDSRAAESCNFDDAGGGVEVILPNTSVKRTIYWKTHGSSLELYENSLQVNLIQNHIQIEFQHSKILPNVKIFLVNKQVVILCASLHAAHRIVLNIAKLKQNQSILSNLSESSFSLPNHNFYFTQIEQVTCFTSSYYKKRQSSTAMFAFGVNTGNVIVLKMPTKGQAVLTRLNQPSRIARIFSGINPWSGSNEADIPCDLTIIGASDPIMLCITRDNKVKIWSAKSGDCLNQLNLCEFLNEDHHNRLGKSHQIRSTVSSEDDIYIVSVYLSFEEVFLFLSFQYDQENYFLQHFSTIECGLEVDLALNSKLVDYQITPSYYLWVMWQDAEDEMSLSVCHMNQKAWHDVALATSPSQEVVVPPHLTIHEAYMESIFSPGIFSPIAIAKALSIHQRSVFSGKNLAWKSLRESVIKLLHGEIQNQLPDDGSASLSDTMDAQISTWQRFYQTCLQYQKSANKPLGMTNPSIDGIAVVKKNVVSHLVALSSLEAICRGAKPSMCNIEVSEDPNVDELGKLVHCLSLLSNMLGLDYLDNLIQSLAHYDSPIDLIKDEMDSIKALMNDRLYCSELQEHLMDIGDMELAVNMLLTCLDPRASEFGFISKVDRDLTGDGGIEVLCRVVKRYVSDRLQLSLLLLILTTFIDELQNTGPPRVATYVQAYSAIKWAVTATVEHVSQSSLETTLQSLSVHEVQQSLPATLIEYYLCDQGGVLLQQILDLDGVLNQDVMPRAVAAVVQLLWPTGPTMSFPEFLLSKGQFSRLQHYLDQELYPWCDFCPSYTLFLLGTCQLHTGQYNKAVETFLHGASKVTGEEVHLFRMLEMEEGEDIERVESAFFTKTLQTFEKMDLAEQVILIANHAIEKIPADDPNLPLLCSSVFYQSLNLRRHDEAYKAIVWNPDPEHKKDCLRTMVVALCERKEYKTLVEYPYDDLQEDLVQILEHRARCSDLTVSSHQYYDLLFAFHVYRENYRRAASTMYEQAWRIGLEQASAAAVRRRHTCLVSAVSCLLLVDSDNHWLVHPASSQEPNQKAGWKSPKRDYEGEELEYSEGSRKIVVCELEDLRKEILLVEARLKISGETKDLSAVSAATSPQETVSLLNHVGLYEDAFALCTKFNISPITTFQSMATKCVQSSYVCDDAQATSWIAKHDHVAHVDGRSSAADVAWRLLKSFLQKHGNSPGCYRVVLTTLLSYNYSLPAWFVGQYKKLNAAELIRMLICYDYLEQATSVCLDYIDAIMGVGPEDFNIKSTLSSIGPPVWLPYNEMEQLLHALKEDDSQTKHIKLNDLLSSKIDYYFMEAGKVATAKWIL